ncbi:MAG: ABC transporter permease [Nitrospirae bacterium]|nr:ABC transporter permease [Nitrospirota bacterium]
MRYLRLVASLARLLRQNAYMIRAMVIRDMRARYMGSFLGFFWSVIHPLTQLLIYYFVFGVVMKMRLGPEYGGANYAVWLIAGLLPWMLFAEAVTRAPNAVLEQSSLVKKMVFPSEIFPIVNLTAAIVNHLIAVAILLGFLVLSGYGLSFKIALIFPYLFLTGLLVLGISWLLSAVNVFLRDIGQIISVVVNIWFFLTPVVYARQLIPDRLQALYALNPMLHVVEGYRAALLGRTDVDLAGVAYLLVAGLLAFGLGGLVFKKLKPAFADVL